MYITDSNQYSIKLVTYLLVLVVHFYEFIVYMLLERNAFDSIAFFFLSVLFKRPILALIVLLFIYIGITYFWFQFAIKDINHCNSQW